MLGFNPEKLCDPVKKQQNNHFHAIMANKVPTSILE
jgi:hypothetical protein